MAGSDESAIVFLVLVLVLVLVLPCGFEFQLS
jgi:fumarate reductase subunit D